MAKKKPKERPYYIKQLKDLMRKNKVTQESLGKIINKTRPTVASYLDGRTHIDVKTLQELADYFEVPITFFFEEGKDEGAQPEVDYSKAGIDMLGSTKGLSIEEIAMAAGSQVTPPKEEKASGNYDYAMTTAIESLNKLVDEKERVIKLLEAQLQNKKGRK